MSTYKYKQALVRAKNLLVEKGWTQGTSARDVFGLPTDLTGRGTKKPACYCLSGALLAADPLVYDETYEIVKGFTQEMEGCSPVTYNDREGRKKEEILFILNEAITSCS